MSQKSDRWRLPAGRDDPPGRQADPVARTRRISIIAIVLTAAILSVAACSNDGSRGAAASPPASPQSATTHTPSSKCVLSAKLVPSCGVLWGIYTKRSGSENWQTAFTDLESQTGRTFDIVKRYHDWSNEGSNGPFPDQYEQALGASGQRILYFAWVSNTWANGGHADWADIADGKYDQSVILPEAARIKAWGKPVFIGYDHEADGPVRASFGTPAQYVAAFRHIHDEFAAAGVTNVVWVYNPTGYVGNEAKIAALYPGNAYVDWIAYDPYNTYQCHNTAWKDPATTFTPFYNYLEAAGFGDKPFMLGEYGSAPDPSNANAMGDWYGGVASALTKLPNIKAAIMWNSSVAGGPKCDFRLSTNAHALQGFAESGHAASLQVNTP